MSTPTLDDYRAAARWLRVRRDVAMELLTECATLGEPAPSWFEEAFADALRRAGYAPEGFHRVADELRPELERLYIRTPRRLKQWQVEALALELVNRVILELLEPDWGAAL